MRFQILYRIIGLYVIFSLKSDGSSIYNEIANIIRSKSTTSVYLKGSYGYHNRRQVRNGACANIYPDMIVVPKSTTDVSKIMSIARYYRVSISVRSGGHTYMCQSTKPGNRTTKLIILSEVFLIIMYKYRCRQ